MTTWVRAAMAFSVDGLPASTVRICQSFADSPRVSRTPSTRSVDLPASAMRAPPPALARYWAVSFPTKPVAPYNTMSNSRGVAVTGPTLLRGYQVRFPPMTQRIVVIGAGIAGLATAVALQRRGYDVSVIEERSDTSPGAAISIWPNALAALDTLGLGDGVRAAGGRVTAGALRRRDGSWLRHPPPQRLIRPPAHPLAPLPPPPPPH